MRFNQEVLARIEELLIQKHNPSQAAKIVIEEFGLLDKFETVRYYARQINDKTPTKPTKTINYEDVALQCMKTPISIHDIASKLNTDITTVYGIISELEGKGHNIYNEGEQFCIKTITDSSATMHETNWQSDTLIRFAVVSDTHINSRYAQITLLHDAYDEIKRQGISCVYHCGDIDEGDQMRMGHQYECYNQGADDHVDEIVKSYPKRDGIKTYFITGNHDHSFIKRNGLDIGKMISAKRPDMKYLGQSQAYVNLTSNCIMELRHPADGTAYAISYKPQKMVEAISGGKKPKIIFIGHYHKGMYMFYRNVHIFQAGALEAQSDWMRGKGISVSLGFWTIEIMISKDGQINQLKQTFHPFYEEIENDYKNWR